MIILILELAARAVYASRQIESEWAKARPADIPEDKWADKRKQCGEAKLTAAECASTSGQEFEERIIRARATEQAKLCARDDRFEARREAQAAVSARPKSPSSASFIGNPSFVHDRCKWTISGQVDSQNSSGATLPARYLIELLHASEEMWVPTSVRIME